MTALQAKKPDLNKKAAGKLSLLSIENLCQMFEMTNGDHSTESPVVRGWIMDELEKRDPVNFDRWIDEEDPAKMEYPSLFFCKQ